MRDPDPDIETKGPRSYRALPSERPEAPPGTIRTPKGETPKIFVVHYDEEGLDEREIQSLDEVPAMLERGGVTWIDVRGIGDPKLFDRLGEMFHIHPLAIEDCINVPQRPKTDVYKEHQIFVTRMVTLDRSIIVSEQLSIVFAKGWVVTVQEEPDIDCLGTLRQRIRDGRGVIRSAGADYLAYALFDAVIDGYYPVLEEVGEALDKLEEEVTESTQSKSREIFAMKRELLQLRRAIWPQRDLLASLLRDPSPHIKDETRPYFRDTYDHAVQIMDMVETFREIASSLMDLFMTGVSNRLNEVMKVLTILSTVFLPMTFIAGVYGMNFDTSSPFNMPELRWAFGYPFSIVLMLSSAGGLLLYYRHRGWIGNAREKRRRRQSRASNAGVAQLPGRSGR